MKRLALMVGLSVCYCIVFSQTMTHIAGSVKDEAGNPLSFVNVYVKETLKGAVTGVDGSFRLSIAAKDSITLIASSIGYQTFLKTGLPDSFEDITIVLHSDETILNDIVITVGSYSIMSSSTLENKNAVDLVTTAGSEGDLYKAVSLLPGTQASGVDGRLIVRGGSSRETQTYIDDMHVLSPYTFSSGNFSSWGRYSPFLFEGIHFSTGGYSSEYSQSLSAVLPLETKNVSDISKFGVEIMNVSIGSGGTKAWKKGSASFNVDYTDLSLYNTLFYPSVKKNWKEPYRKFGAQNQLRFELGKDTYLKTYFAYDKTGLNLIQSDLPDSHLRDFDLDEDNAYLNATFRKKQENGFNWFAGIAYSLNNRNIRNLQLVGDKAGDKEQEWHVKVKAGKRFSNRYKFEAGAESMVKDKDLQYDYHQSSQTGYSNNIHGVFISNDLNLTRGLFLNISSRAEYAGMNKSFAFLPRIALGYQWNKIHFSGVLGRYQQSASNDFLRDNPKLDQEKSLQSLFCIYYQENSKIYRVEFYHKQYSDLAHIRNGGYVSDGSGYSRGIDVFFNDYEFMKHWNYMIAYSYNDTKRSLDGFPEKVRPNYATRHNVSFTLKYSNFDMKSVIGLTNRTASGRPYHHPDKPGYMNSTAPVYNSLDLSYTFLAHKNVIIYASWSNIFNRENIFNYEYAKNTKGQYIERPVKLQQNQSFYIGVFITLGKNIAYDVSNF